MARMFRLRHLDSGQTAAEYVGILAVVVLVIGGVVGATVGTDITEKIGQQVCKIGGGSCGSDGSGGGDQPQAAGPDGAGSNDGGDAKSPEDAAYDKALKDLAKAKKDLQSSEDKAIKAAKELGKILADELGITDAFKCITEGDASACTETVLNVLSSLIGGAIGKLAKKYGAPWKWDDAARLIKRIKNHGGDLYDGIKSLIKNRKKVSDAEDALKKAAKNCEHSFPAGTQVVLAGGGRVAIEDVRAGDRVLVTDPARPGNQIRKVAATITTKSDKYFTRLKVRVGAGAAELTTTDTHPFWLQNTRRWAEAGDIRVGDKLRSPAGKSLEVLDASRFERQMVTHDLSIEGIHTYYVELGSSAALVHNCPAKKPKKRPAPPPQPKEVDDAVKGIEDGTHPQRLNPDGTPDNFEARAGTPPAVARKWKDAKIYEVPGKGNNYRILVNKYGDIGYTDNHYGRILPYRPRE